ncbi:MAG: HAMP domain-containing protein [Chlorobiaceae bacterium]|nr:HAMP domain-containing protein [Chlorobiaceae bacterium]
MTGSTNNKHERHGAGWKRIPSMSLRNRMAFYYTVTTAFLLAVVFAAILLMVDRIVYIHFDEELRHEVAETLEEAHVKGQAFVGFESFRCIDGTEEELDEYKQRGKKKDADSEFIQVVDSTGQMVRKSVNLSRNLLTFNPAYSGVRYFNSFVAGEPVRQVQVPLVNSKGIADAYLIIAVPMKSAMIILLDLQNIMLVSFPAVILILFILTRAIAGRSIRPIEEVIATAEKMTQASLDQRIPMPHNQDELYRLSATINALFDRLQDAFQREKQFTADASHELKTPLAVVKGTLDVLVRKPRDIVHYEDRIRYCLDELNRMARLIDQLLMLARYENDTKNPNIVKVEISESLHSVISRIELLALEKQISIRLENTPSGTVAADPAMLEMMLENILSNAIKYSPAGSSIEIATSRRAVHLVCTITDHGVGIPEEKLQKIFDRFYRVDESRSSSTGGFGLGLSIVRKLADLQHIGISVSSTRNTGTTFELTFPAL